jgi:hypothetical protein
MSKWVCINDKNIKSMIGGNNSFIIKEGEIYEGEYNQIRDLIYIKLEDGSLYGYNSHRFRPLAEIREEQIKSVFGDE